MGNTQSQKGVMNMKINKEFLGCFLAVVFSIGSLSVYATDTGSGASGGSGGSSPVVSVILPTNNNLDFSIDPYGLSAMGSSQSLEELLKNPSGLVTSSAAKIQNTGEAGITVTGEVYLQSNMNITLAKTEAEAKVGNADLYLTISPKENTSGWKPIAVTKMVANGSSVSGDAFSFYLDKRDGVNTTYEFVIDGYANPKCEAWQQMHEDSVTNTIQLTMKFTIESDELPEESTEVSSETSTTSGETTTTTSGGQQPSEEETTKDPLTHVVCGEDGTCTITVQKAKLNRSEPSTIMILYAGIWYDLYDIGYYECTSSGDSYVISVRFFDLNQMQGEYPLQILDANNIVIFDDLAITFQ